MPPRRKAAPRRATTASSSSKGSKQTRGSNEAFPSGTYGKYKRATEFFLRWLLRARDGGVGVGANTNNANNANKPKQPLDVYEKVVAAIAREPTTLPPALLSAFPRALEACETAITLRARVALFFPDTAYDDDDSHAHFLHRLTAWFQTLKAVGKATLAATKAARDDANKSNKSNKTNDANDEEPHVLDFSNYYDVLALPEDYFSATSNDDELFASSALASAPTIRPLSAAERRRLFDEAFDEDVQVELACFFLELEELSEAVYKAFYDVKRQHKTLLEATVVAKVAIDGATGVIARLQLRYPMIEDGIDLMVMMSEFFPFEALESVRDDVLAAWTPTPTLDPTNYPTYQYVRGTILWDVLWAARGLRKFATSITPGARDPLIIHEGLYGETYSEERTPQYMTPNLFVMQSFLAQQLPLLHNLVVENRFKETEFDPRCLRQWYMAPFERYFETSRVSVELVFIGICWVRSVAALQGNLGLGRTISLSVTHRWDLEDRLNASIIRGNMQQTDPKFHKIMEAALYDMQEDEDLVSVLRAHPILAGCALLDHHGSYLFLGSQAAVMTTRFRAFCHIYSALRDRELLDGIPFFEETMDVYERALFTPTRAAATHGSFLRTFLASSNMTDASIEAIFHDRDHATGRKKYTTRTRESYTLGAKSPLFRLLMAKDYSVFPSDLSKTTAWTKLLNAVSTLCADELYESRVLSRDMLKLSDDLVDVFNALCDTLDRRGAVDSMAAEMDPRTPLYVRKGRASVDAVINPLLPLLDTLQLDGTAVLTSDTAGLLRIDTTRPDWSARGQAMSELISESVVGFSRRAASVIATRFGGLSASHIEKVYFTYPPTPNVMALAFGDATIRIDAPRTATTMETFQKLMTMLTESPGPLSADQVATLKQHVMDDPALLSMVLPGADTELCTLLHHAVAGRVRDRRLVEWLIQMGALYRQPPHFHNPPEVGQTRWAGFQNDQLCDYMAVHSAAKAGLPDMVRLLLGADHFRDTNKVTYQTKDSIAHIAVRNSDRGVLSFVMRMGANVTHKNAAGKYVHDLTTNPKWKRELLTSVVEQRKHDELIQEFKRERAKGFQIQQDRVDQAEQLRGRLDRQRDAAASGLGNTTTGTAQRKPAASAPSSSVAPTTTAAATAAAESSASKKNKKKKKKKNDSELIRADDEVTAMALQRMEELAVSKKASVAAAVEDAGTESDDRIERLTGLVDSLMKGGIGGGDSEATAAAALEIVDAIKTKVLYVAQSTNLAAFSGRVVLRDATDASRVLFLLSKYHRQLPPCAAVPRAQLWQLESPLPLPTTALGKLQQRAGPALDFTDFLSFLALTSALFVSYGRTAQAAELLDLLERRLLKLTPRVRLFREFVSTLVDGRANAGIATALGTATDARRQLAWYTSDHGITSAATLAALDLLHGCRVFCRLGPLIDDLTTAFTQFTQALATDEETENDDMDAVVVYVDRHVVVGAQTTERVDAAMAMITRVATQYGVRVPQATTTASGSGTHETTATLTLKGFEFSATGIVRI